MTDLIAVKDAAALLDIGHQRISQLVGSGRLDRAKRGYLTQASVERYRTYKEMRSQRHGLPWPPTRHDQRAIVQVLLLAGVINRTDIADLERERIATALNRAHPAENDMSEPTAATPEVSHAMP